MGLVVEVGSAVGSRGRPAEVVDGQSVDASLGEAQRQLLVISVEAAHIGQHQHRRAGRRRGARLKAHERVAIFGDQLDAMAVDGCSGDGWDGWPAVVVKAHGCDAIPAGRGCRPTRVCA